jgi:hypothetical protein
MSGVMFFTALIIDFQLSALLVILKKLLAQKTRSIKERTKY